MSMKAIEFPANSRGYANHGWLKTFYSFSFANYYNPQRVQFGALRVLNDDFIAPQSGFGMHPHDNMEIITIMLDGELTHEDSMGHRQTIKAGDVQVMSAGTGIYHSEFNNHPHESVCLFQIWIFPDKKNVTPRYAQQTVDIFKTINELKTVVEPFGSTSDLWIHQNAWLSGGHFTDKQAIVYKLKQSKNVVFVFNVNGSFTINNHLLSKRDALGCFDTDSIEISVNEPDTDILIIEVPAV